MAAARFKRKIKAWEIKMFPPIPITIIKEPVIIKLNDKIPNPHGKIVPPNSPVTPRRKI